MGIFDSFRKKRPQDSSVEKRPEASPQKGQPAPGKWQVGDRIADRYEVYRVLEGGMGIVYICYDHELREPVALKTLKEKILLSAEGQELFEREALLWTNLERHHYIVRALWVQRLEGRLFIGLEYIAPDDQGRNTLTHYRGSLALPEILKLSIQFCYGMEYAYSKGVDAHRDIKPDNIMITRGRTAKITDFGLVKALGEIQTGEDAVSFPESTSLSIFHSGGKRICGTLPYMAPEQFDGHADRRSDVYSFGITLYEVVTGKPPFVAGSTEEYEKLHRHGKTPAISSPLFPIIEKCVKKEPDKRYQDFAGVREELQKILLKETGETLPPPQLEELEASELGNKGLAFHALGKPQEAVTCFDEAIRLSPRLAEVWSNKGGAFSTLGKPQEAVTCFDEAIRIDPRLGGVWSNKGIALCALGRYQEAVTCCDEAIRINPRLTEAWTNKGNALCDLGRHQEAITCFDEAIRINPGYAEAWLNKGAALSALGRNQEAITCLDEAIRLSPRLAEAWNNKGVALGALGRYQEEVTCCDEAIRINPGYAEAWLNKGAALLNVGRYQEAVTCYDEAIRINSRLAKAWLNKGAALSALGRNQEAITCLDEAIRLSPRLAEAWNNKGVALRAHGRHQEAITCLDEAIRINPGYAEAWYIKGLALCALGRYQEAVTCCDEAIRINPGFATAWYGKGVALSALGRNQEAVTCLEKFLELASPQHASVAKKAEELIRQLKQKL